MFTEQEVAELKKMIAERISINESEIVNDGVDKARQAVAERYETTLASTKNPIERNRVIDEMVAEADLVEASIRK